MKAFVIGLLLMLFLIGMAFADQPEKDAITQDRALAATALGKLEADFPDIRTYSSEGRTSRLYGRPFAFGSSPEASAEQIRINNAEIFGANAEDLKPYSLLSDKRHTQPVMYDQESGDYKFTLVYYTQERDGIPVFGADLRVLVKNQPDNPVVWAGSALRFLGDFSVTSTAINNGALTRARSTAQYDFPELVRFSEPELVIFAGYDSRDVRPRLALKFKGFGDDSEKHLFIADAETGEILYEENLIIFDVSGTVSGMATEGLAADICAFEFSKPLPYSKVSVGANSVYTNSKGGFTIFSGGGDSVDVTSELAGQYFHVYNYTGPEEILTKRILPPGPVYFLHNEANSSESVRAQTNAYLQTNRVRDMALTYNPTYPAVSTQTDFPVYTNRTDGYCPGNAWYDPGEESINFCSSGDGHPNTAWQSVIFHEYGHHLVNMAGSGQGQYGEGMADVTAMLNVDDPRLGLGFYGPCDEYLRTADNDYQYPCTSDIHDCAQLLSGCVWDTRNALILTEPGNYLKILTAIAINAILLHSGTEITPQITIDYLTLDDDDGDINNGTPHYNDICSGFGAHNMDCPELIPVLFTYPDGRPETMQPNADSTFSVNVTNNVTDPIPGSAEMYYSIDGGAYVPGTIVETSTNIYDITLPATACGSSIDWYIQVETDGFGTVTDPEYAPGNHYTTITATTHIITFEDDFESDLGWTVSGGSWARGIPTGGGGQYGNPDPTSGVVGSSVFGYNLNGDYENSMPERHLTSPVLDCSDMSGTKLKFWRWLGVEQPIYDHAYIRVSNNGTSWTQIWANDATITDDSWSELEYDISSVADGETTVYIRFTMGSTDGAWQYCGWNIDHVRVSAYSCEGGSQVVIDNPDVPDWTANYPMAYQLTASGGAGELTWSDKNGDLVGTGLSLSVSGLLSGTPTSSGDITFTAEVSDEAKSSAEKVFTFGINEPITVTTASLPDWSVGVAYSQTLSASGGTGTLTFADKNGDLSGTGLTLSTSGTVSGTPSSDGSISFIAKVDDAIGASGEKSFGFDINEAVAITTGAMPDCPEGEVYSEQLISTGGTGTISWSDLSGDLSGTGLILSSEGLLSGTPTEVGTINFTARAEDNVGSSDEAPLTVLVTPVFACGDANNDTEVNIFDVTFLIQYLYSDGQDPVYPDACDVNNDGTVNIFDVTYLIEFLYKDGSDPTCP